MPSFFLLLRSGEGVPSSHGGMLYDSHGLWLWLWLWLWGLLALWMNAGLDGLEDIGVYLVFLRDLTFCQPRPGVSLSAIQALV